MIDSEEFWQSGLKTSYVSPLGFLGYGLWDGGHEQLILNGGSFKPAIAKRDKRDEKQTMIDVRGISTYWLKNKLCPSIGFQDWAHNDF